MGYTFEFPKYFVLFSGNLTDEEIKCGEKLLPNDMLEEAEKSRLFDYILLKRSALECHKSSTITGYLLEQDIEFKQFYEIDISMLNSSNEKITVFHGIETPSMLQSYITNAKILEQAGFKLSSSSTTNYYLFTLKPFNIEKKHVFLVIVRSA